MLFVPTLSKQCWGFMVGSTFFALGAALTLGKWADSNTVNLLYFIGAWFFTAAGLFQLLMSGAVSVSVPYGTGRMVRAEWLAAATQSVGTLLFNVSTSSALTARSVSTEKHFVWSPDAGGSVAFLVSGFLAILAYDHVARGWDPGRRGWWSVQVNLIGCIAFGVSAVGAYITSNGAVINAEIANLGTLIGAVCFFVASFVMLPGHKGRKEAGVREPSVP